MCLHSEHDRRIPFELPRAVVRRECGSAKRRDRAITGIEGVVTFPYSSPENVTVVNVHHDPLPVQWILIDGSTGQRKRSERIREGATTDM